MAGIRSLVDQLFLSVQEESSWYDWICKYCVKMTEIVCAVLIANLTARLGEKMLSAIGIRVSTWILMGIVIVVTFFAIIIGKGRGILAATIDTMAELVIGMIVICLIYMAMICLQMMQMIKAATATEVILILSGFIGSLLALELIEGVIVARGISGLLMK